MTFKDGAKYFGEFNLGKAHGEGTFSSPNKSWVYQGKWYNNFKHGRGQMSQAYSESVYQGEFHFDE
jgi:hypothetical protein